MAPKDLTKDLTERQRVLLEAMFPGILARSKQPAPPIVRRSAKEIVAAWSKISNQSPAPMSLEQRKALAKQHYPNLSDKDIEVALKMGLV